jgi:hypothetical protein
MTTQAKDGNGGGIPCVKPSSAINYTNGNVAAATTNVMRLVSSAPSTYGVNAAASVILPANVVEYIKVDIGDVVTVGGTVNVTECS